MEQKLEGKALDGKSQPQQIRAMRLEVHHDGKGGVTGYTVHHEHVMKASKSGAFSVGQENVSFPFKHEDGGKMMEHVAKHLGIEHHEEDNEGDEYAGEGY